MIRRALLLAALAAPAGAQVIEIGADGQSTLYDRPTMFTAPEAVPIEPRQPPRPAPRPHLPLADAARDHGIPGGLLEAVAWQESRGRMDAISPKGAIGTMQLMPATAAELGVNPFDQAENVRGGALYLRQQLERFRSVPLALAAYNAGPGAVQRFGGIPPYRETRSYVAGILARWRPAAPSAALSAAAVEVAPFNPLLIEVSAQ
jgi:soluble lytic murein transglycosylase-like protein